MYRRYFKRMIDVIVSSVALLLLSPLLALVALAIAVGSKGPVFYTQDRLGYRGKVFKLYKFRSMYVDHSETGQVYEDNLQITPVGRIIRRFKIDELAQLLNILKGDMSFVGPRPCLPSLKAEFNETAFYRLRAKPGLTGLAQINGNIFLPWQERWEFDKQYVSNIAFVNDLKILVKTFLVVLWGEEKFKE